jgi:hypothetical protein
MTAAPTDVVNISFPADRALRANQLADNSLGIVTPNYTVRATFTTSSGTDTHFKPKITVTAPDSSVYTFTAAANQSVTAGTPLVYDFTGVTKVGTIVVTQVRDDGKTPNSHTFTTVKPQIPAGPILPATPPTRSSPSTA